MPIPIPPHEYEATERMIDEVISLGEAVRSVLQGLQERQALVELMSQGNGPEQVREESPQSGQIIPEQEP